MDLVGWWSTPGLSSNWSRLGQRVNVTFVPAAAVPGGEDMTPNEMQGVGVRMYALAL
jgi:hypothetical protein